MPVFFLFFFVALHGNVFLLQISIVKFTDCWVAACSSMRRRC